MFKKSSKCGNATCVAVEITDIVSVKNTTDPERVIVFTLDEWRAFIEGAKNNEFDV